jgi:TonB-linked SusC/RagA family outer membrane protein
MNFSAISFAVPSNVRRYFKFFLMVMKLSTLLLIIALVQASAKGFSQITLHEKNASLEKVFSDVKKQSSYVFLYDEHQLNIGPVNIQVKNATLEETLAIIFKGLPVEYSVVQNNVLIKPKEKTVLENAIGLLQTVFSNINVEGRVTDSESGQPVPGVTIVLKGSKRIVFADEKGFFNFNSLPKGAILVFSYVGYVTQEIAATENINVKMIMANQKLEEVVVSTGYQQVNKASTTGSFTVITADQIASSPSINLLDRLDGIVPGVQFDVRNNTIQIRGVSSYTAVPPLIIIDGFPAQDQNLTTVTSDMINGNPTNQLATATSGNAIISNINPADIESITFLKDAAAAAIWGAKAANGVIVITTKRGKKGTSSINFNSTLSTSAPANFSNMTSMTNRQYIDFEQELFNKGFLTDPTSNWMNAPVSEAQQWMFRAKDRTATTVQRDSALNVLANRSNTGQIKKYLLQRAVTQQHNLSFSGGGDNSSYYVSGNYTQDQPVFKSNSGQKYSILSNLTNDFLNKRLTLTTGVNYNYSKAQVNDAALQALSVGRFGLAPYQMLVDANGNKIYSDITFTKAVADSLIRVNKDLPWGYNPIDELNYNNTITTRNTIRITEAIKGVVTNWLSLSVSGQIQKLFNQQVLLQNKDSYLTRETINLGTVLVNGKPSYGFPKGGVYNSSQSNIDSYNVRTQFDVNKNWSSGHHFDMIGGTEISQTTSSGSEQQLLGYDEAVSSSVNVNTTPSGAYPNIEGYYSRFSPINGTIYRSASRALSYYGMATYSYLGKYFATSSVRFDDLNLLGVARRDRAEPLWSGGLRWNVKKENFMDKITWISSLSLRATLGTSGNPPQGSANYSTISGIGSVDSYSQLPTVYLSSPANQEIGWETTETTNGGIDAGLFNDRLNVTIDIYHKRTYGIIMSLPLNATYGYTSLYFNAGNLSGHGTEVNLTGVVIKTKDWSWTSNFNFSYNTNTVTDTRFPNKNVSGGLSVITTGLPTDNLFVYRWAGLDNTGQSQIYAADGSKISSTSNIALKPQDLVDAGRTTAPYFGGFNNTVRYKDFSFLIRADYHLGNVFLLQTINPNFYPVDGSFGAAGQYSGLLANNSALANRWRKPGDEATTNIPGITGGNLTSLDMFDNSNLNIRNAGYIRLQQISLSYNVPKSILRKTPYIKALSLGATVSNLGLLWVANKEGIDPEYQMTNEFNNLPPSRNYVFNINLSL